MTLVFNASPLIVLTKAGLVDHILPLGSHVMIPSAVAVEIRGVRDPSDAAKCWLEKPLVRELILQPPPISPFVAAWDLGAGESSVIMMALEESGRYAVLDDLAARRCAAALGIKVIGTLGLILMAKRHGVIGSVGKALEAVMAAGLYLSPTHIRNVLSQAGEPEE